MRILKVNFLFDFFIKKNSYVDFLAKIRARLIVDFYS